MFGKKVLSGKDKIIFDGLMAVAHQLGYEDGEEGFITHVRNFVGSPDNATAMPFPKEDDDIWPITVLQRDQAHGAPGEEMEYHAVDDLNDLVMIVISNISATHRELIIQNIHEREEFAQIDAMTTGDDDDDYEEGEEGEETDGQDDGLPMIRVIVHMGGETRDISDRFAPDSDGVYTYRNPDLQA